MDPSFLLSPSNILERFFFSLAGFAFNGNRKRLLPMKLEMQLFLKVNHRLWIELIIDTIVNASGSWKRITCN